MQHLHPFDIIIKLHQIFETNPQHIWVFLFLSFPAIAFPPVRLIDGHYIYTWKSFSGEATRLLTASWILPSWSHSSKRSRWVIRSQQTSQQCGQIADTPAVLTQDIKLRGIELGSVFGIIEKLLLFLFHICLSGAKKVFFFITKKPVKYILNKCIASCSFIFSPSNGRQFSLCSSVLFFYFYSIKMGTLELDPKAL